MLLSVSEDTLVVHASLHVCSSQYRKVKREKGTVGEGGHALPATGTKLCPSTLSFTSSDFLRLGAKGDHDSRLHLLVLLGREPPAQGRQSSAPATAAEWVSWFTCIAPITLLVMGSTRLCR